MSSIPASRLVNVIPSVLAAGGNPLSLNAVFLTNNTAVPIGTVQAFSTLDDVQDFFGIETIESYLAAVYFNGYEGAQTLPGTLYFSQYNSAAVAAYLRGGVVSSMTLAQIQALSGTITITVDGVADTTGAIDLSAATSFSNAASIIDTALNLAATGCECSYDSQRGAFVLTSDTTGATSTISFATANSLTTGLKLTEAAGAVLSQGAATATPATAMEAVTDETENWVSFTTCFEPSTELKVSFAQWVQTTSDRYMYVGWFSDTAPLAGAAPSSFPGQVQAANMSGVVCVYEPATDAGNGRKAAFICGITGSIDFDQPQGRLTYAYKGQGGLVADITNATQADNLTLNGANFYGAYATANDRFVNLQTGVMPGPWGWIDAYVNQIWLNNELQLALMMLLTQIRSLPYNATGYNLLRAAALDPISRALTAGVIQPGVTLSNSQRAQINTAAGANVADTLQTSGWYLQILDAAPEVRAQRESPPMTLWYMDGGSIQKIELQSISVQ